jgi:hypothetical protein
MGRKGRRGKTRGSGLAARKLDFEPDAAGERQSVRMIGGIMRVLAVAALLSITTLIVAGARAQSPLPDPCGVPQAARVLLGISGNVGGVEYLPSAGLCRYSTAGTTRVPLDRARVADSLNRLVAFDTRYRWGIQDGVIVLRPAVAWDDSEHFLHKQLPSFAVDDVTFVGAVGHLLTRLAGFSITGDSPGEHPTKEMSQRLSLSLTDTTVMGALNGMVRQHGALVWEVNYCKPSARYESADFQFRTFDGGAFGEHTAVLDEKGAMQERCFAR